ncbi:uncharacterized protein [Amphiura filiformis]|uniref:uncharacterized protein n=1 Tax=Amphiura filiformis TaxID=82378 RepID=UPI003B219D59
MIMAEKLTIVFILLASLAVEYIAADEIFIFQQPEYILEETPAGNNVNLDVIISRSGDVAETSLATTVTLSTACPIGVQATAISGSDYTAPTTVVFNAGDLLEEIQVAIIADDDEEYREFFCLTITTNPGSQYTSRIYIPGNDYCLHTSSPISSNANSIDPQNFDYIYVGPWLVGNPGIPDAFDIDVLPEPQADGGNGEQINIWLRNIADQSVNGNYYGLLLDIVDAIDDPFNGNGVAEEDSIVVKDASTFVGTLNDNSATGIDVVATAGDDFTVQYTESNAQFVLTDRGNNAQYNADDNGQPIDVSHVFVSSGNDNSASWTLCGMLPRRLPTVSASASGFKVGNAPIKAMDNDRNENGNVPNTGCFISDSVTDPWLQIDLGREFAVMMVLIWPVTPDGTTAQPSWLDNADVYVGSCPATTSATLTSNNLCHNNIGVVGVKTVIEAQCGANSYGRYVYVHLDTTAARTLALCEVEVYGDDVPVDDEATVEFSAATFAIADDESAQSVTITAIRHGAGLTCTSVDFYTDASGVINGGGADFTPVLSNSPVTLTWEANDSNGTTTAHNVVIVNDDECESTETFNVFLTNVDGGILGTQSFALVSIIDDDSATYALTSPTFSVAESSSVNIGVSRSGTGTMQTARAGLTFTDVTAQAVDYGSAAGVVPFTSSSSSPQYHTVITVDDDEYEGDETFTVTISTLQPSTCSTLGIPSTATVTLTDNDSKFTWGVSDDTITIGEGTSTTTLRITREGLVQSKSVSIDVDEVSADFSTDFSISQISASFAISDASESINIYVDDDSLVEGDESFTLTLKDPSYTTGHRNLYGIYRVTIVIQDNDAKYTWKQSEYTTSESSGTLEVCLLRSGDTSTTKTIDVNSVSGTASGGVDFTPLTQIMFDGNTEACGNVVILGDSAVENTEILTLSILDGQQNVVIGDTQTAQVSITDDDSTVSWERLSYSFRETSDTNVVKITKTGSGSKTVTITSQQVTATHGVDYAPVATTVTVTGDVTDLSITIYDDDSDEPTETFTLTLSAAGITSLMTSITILDDDPTPTTPPPDEGLGAGAIAGIIAAALIAGVGAIIALALCCMFLTRTGICARVAKPTPASAGFPAGFQGYPLATYGQPAALANFGGDAFGGNTFAIDNRFGNYPNQQFAGFNQPALGLGFP